MSNVLYHKLIRLAYREPEFRPQLLPILEEYGKKQAGRFSASRKFYLPPEMRDTPPMQPEGTNLAIWQWELGNGTPVAVAFQGRSQKPLWHQKFTSPSTRRALIQETIEDNLAMQAAKKKRREERKKFQPNVDVGDIFASSWGYNQTNVDFYEVVGRRGKTIAIVRPVAKKVVSSSRGSEKVVAAPGKFTDGPMRKKILLRGDTPAIKIDSVSTAYLWDGKPKYQTASGWGH